MTKRLVRNNIFRFDSRSDRRTAAVREEEEECGRYLTSQLLSPLTFLVPISVSHDVCEAGERFFSFLSPKLPANQQHEPLEIR